MGLMPYKLSSTRGLSFYKLLGCGSGGGFNLLPDLSQYVFLGVWESEKDAIRFLEGDGIFSEYVKRSADYQHLFMRTLKVYGLWSSIQPFTPITPLAKNSIIAVITRATIRWKDVLRFRKDIPYVVKSLKSSHKPLIAIGIGEYPLRYQATFSIWQSEKAMHDFAYGEADHLKMIRKTKETGWYSEDMFARFEIYKSLGSKIVDLSEMT